MARNIVYYVPNIPDVWSTDRYQHALGLLSSSDNGILLTNDSVPGEIERAASDIHTIGGGGFKEAKQAASIATEYLSAGEKFVTSYHYEPTLSGLIAQRAGIQWIADIYETPAQYRLNAPYSHHQLTSRLLERMLEQSDRSIHSFHPDTPYQYGSDRRFITNGSPTEKVSPLYMNSNPLRMVWAGSPRIDRGGKYLIQALSELSDSFRVDIYGDAKEDMKRLVDQYNLSDSINFHGWTNHNDVLAAIRKATVGYAVLPPRKDWKFAPAIKIGEYLAGGTIPLVSAFPGSRYIAGEAGYYVRPSVKGVKTALSEIMEISISNRQNLMRKARAQGESISWKDIRRRFITHTLQE